MSDVGNDAGAGAKAAASRPEHAQRMGLIDDEDGVGLCGGFGQGWQGGEVPVHAEEGFGDKEASPEAACARAEEAAGGRASPWG